MDPTGEAWEISTQIDDNGVTHVNITITGVVYNNSSHTDINLNDLASAIKNQIESVWTFSTDKYKVNTTANIRVAESAEDVTETDHVFQIVNKDLIKRDGKMYPANGSIKGLNIRMTPQTAHETISKENVRTIAHELGHTGGLEHPGLDNPIYILNTGNNIMTQTKNVGDPHNAANVENDQIQSVINAYQNSELNQRSPLKIQHYINIGKYHFFPYKIITPYALRKR